MDKTVARLNIEHYRKLLANEADETRRRTLQHLLAEQEAKLAALEGDPPKKTNRFKLSPPFAPVRRSHVDSLFGFRAALPNVRFRAKRTWRPRHVR